jgi:hypothetical protein
MQSPNQNGRIIEVKLQVMAIVDGHALCCGIDKIGTFNWAVDMDTLPVWFDPKGRCLSSSVEIELGKPIKLKGAEMSKVTL